MIKAFLIPIILMLLLYFSVVFISVGMGAIFTVINGILNDNITFKIACWWVDLLDKLLFIKR